MSDTDAPDAASGETTDLDPPLAADLRDRIPAPRKLLENPLVVVALVATILQGYAAVRFYGSLPAGTWPLLRDSAEMEYIGWYITQGNRLYIDVWQVKPPLAFELMGVFALLAGDSVTLYHTLNLLATSGALVGGAVVAAAIVRELTDDALAAAVGGLGVFMLPAYFWRALVGFKPKYFVVLLGLLSIWLLLRDRPLLAGATGGAVVGFWQLAVVFPAVGLAATVDWGDRSDARRFVAGGIGVGALTLLPVVAWGALPAMLAETALTPILATEGATAGDRLQLAFRLLSSGHPGETVPFVIIGLAGYAGSLRSDRIDRGWPLAAAVGWFTLVLVFFDLDFYPDLFPWFALIAIGIGLLVGREGGHVRRILAASVLVMALLSVLTLGGFGTGQPGIPPTKAYDVSADFEVEQPYDRAERQYLFWNRVETSTCRAFAGGTQRQLIRAANLGAPGQPYWEVPCGRFSPVWDAVVAKYT
jgi:hypothetical protein